MSVFFFTFENQRKLEDLFPQNREFVKNNKINLHNMPPLFWIQNKYRQ